MLKFGQGFANEIRRRLPRADDKWRLDEVVIALAVARAPATSTHRARRDAKAAKRLLRKLLKRQGRAPWVTIADKLTSDPAAKKELLPAGTSG